MSQRVGKSLTLYKTARLSSNDHAILHLGSWLLHTLANICHSEAF
jgi:hypothetical protein